MECSRKVIDVLSELGADPENIMFHAIHRTGNPNNTGSSNSAVSNEDSTESREGTSRPPRPRPILVRFVSRMKQKETNEMPWKFTLVERLYCQDKTCL